MLPVETVAGVPRKDSQDVWASRLRELKDQLRAALGQSEMQELLRIVADRGWNHEAYIIVSPVLARLSEMALSTWLTLHRQQTVRTLKPIGMSAEDIEELERAMGVDGMESSVKANSRREVESTFRKQGER